MGHKKKPEEIQLNREVDMLIAVFDLYILFSLFNINRERKELKKEPESEEREHNISLGLDMIILYAAITIILNALFFYR